jgi:hypothetical protein
LEPTKRLPEPPAKGAAQEAFRGGTEGNRRLFPYAKFAKEYAKHEAPVKKPPKTLQRGVKRRKKIGRGRTILRRALCRRLRQAFCWFQNNRFLYRALLVY